MHLHMILPHTTAASLFFLVEIIAKHGGLETEGGLAHTRAGSGPRRFLAALLGGYPRISLVLLEALFVG